MSDRSLLSSDYDALWFPRILEKGQLEAALEAVEDGHLTFGDIVVDVEGAKALATALKKTSTITELDLSFQNIGTEGVTALAEALYVNRSLARLEIYVAPPGASRREALPELALRASGHDCMEYACVEIANALRVNTTLTYLDISHNKIGVRGFNALVDVLETNRTLTHLCLRGNVDSQMCCTLADALNKSNLLSLDISYNNIDELGYKALATALKTNRVLESLEIAEEEEELVEDTRGVKYLALALHKNTTLKFLTVTVNNYDDIRHFDELRALNNTIEIYYE
jgi:Ran GTPase-activating protein (RanGAP) involved in mRNA processing and transport